MDLKRLSGSIGKTWENSIVDRWSRTLRIPHKSPDFDRNGSATDTWRRVQLMRMCRAQPLTGMRVEVRRLPAGPRCCCSTARGAPGVRVALRASGQAAGIHRLAAGLGPWVR